MEKAQEIAGDSRRVADLLSEIESLKAQIKERDEKIDVLEKRINLC